MTTREHRATLERLTAETLHDGRGILEAMCREAGPANWDRPLEALEMYAEARRFMEDEIRDLVSVMRNGSVPPFAWEEIADRLGVTRQTAWTRYRSVERGDSSLPQRPGPRTEADRVDFQFRVNKSYNDRGEITVPTVHNKSLDDRLRGNGPSWSATLRLQVASAPIKLRRGRTGGNDYYQLRLPTDVRETLRLRRDEVVDVRIELLGSLDVEIARRT
jgi:hypothetical protein